MVLAALTACSGGPDGGTGAAGGSSESIDSGSTSAAGAAGAPIGPSTMPEIDGARFDGGSTIDVGGDVNMDVSHTGAPLFKFCDPVAAGNHEKYQLPPPNVPAGLSSLTNWMVNSHSGGWYGQQAMDACRMAADGSLTWHGKAASRVEVDPGDDPLALHANSERAEVLTLQTTDGTPILDGPASGTQYYATSYYFPPDWAGTQLPWSAYPKMDCASGNQEQCNSWSFVMQFHGDTIAWGGLVAAQTSVGGPQHYDLTLGGKHFPFPGDGPIALGKWTDFVLELNWATGDLHVWRRDEGETNFTSVAVGTASIPAEKMYLKQGLYRGANVGGRTDLFRMGPTAQGSTFAAVEEGAFGTRSGP
jgi:hypothetical protein